MSPSKGVSIATFAVGLSVAVGIAVGAGLGGAVAVESFAQGRDHPEIAVRTAALVSASVAAVLVFVSALVVGRRLTRPLANLARSADAASRGEPVEWPSADGEIGVLARALATLHAELGETTAALARESAAHAGEAAARERESRRAAHYHDVVQASHDAVVTAGIDGTITGWNTAAEKQLGYRADEAIDRALEIVVPGAHREKTREIFDRVTRGERFEELDGESLHRSGAVNPMSFTASPTRTASGEITGVAFTLHDTADRRFDEERFRLAVEASPTGMLMTAADGEIVYANAEAGRIFGHGASELIGTSVDLLVPMRSRSGHRDLRARFLASPRKRAMGGGLDLHGRRKDGSEFPIEIGLNPIPTRDGMLVLCAVVDISERKQNEDELRRQRDALARSNRDLEAFAYVASHDLQEPLRMVASYTELIAQRYRGRLDDKADKYIAYAVDGAKRMQRLIADLLTYSRVGSEGKLFARVDCRAEVESVLGDLALAIERSEATVAVGALPAVLGDAVQIRQIFQNLIGNALKFHQPDRPPNISIAATRAGEMWRISVSDDGVGIDPAYRDKVFAMFQRLHPRDRYEGSGIGLAIVKRIVERHGGGIDFESQPNEGTTFFFTLQNVSD
jgi:PAS domain S-box-containing protein